MEKLHARSGKARRITRLRERHERPRHLRRGIEPLRGVDANPESRDERVELCGRERLEDVHESNRLA